MVSLCTLGSCLHVAEVLVLVLVEIVDVQFALVADGSEDGRRVRCPLDVTDLVLEVEGNDGALHILYPHLDRPISTAAQECLRVVWVPLHSVDRQIMILVRLQVLA